MASRSVSQLSIAQRLRQRAVSSAAALMIHSGYLTRRLRRQRGLRILTYHGVCADEVGDESWLPPHFVTESHFASQVRILTGLGRVVHLPEVIGNLANGPPLDEPCFAITFDDGHACTLRHAVPTMNEMGIKATFFVATGHIDNDTWFLSDRLRVLRNLPGELVAKMQPQLRFYLESPTRSKDVPHDEVRSLVDEHWSAVAGDLAPRAHETLRPMSWDQLADLHDNGYEIGAHTVSHVILEQETQPRREAEIVNSVRRVREKISRCDGFAYPNGGPSDFNDHDVRLLRREGVRYALTTSPGPCDSAMDLHRLPRSSIGLGHDDHIFTLEMSGCLDPRRRKQHTGEWRRETEPRP